MDLGRQQDPARLGEALQARGDVDAVAVDRAVGLLDDVAEIDADAIAHAAILGDPRRTAPPLPPERPPRHALRRPPNANTAKIESPGGVDDATVVRLGMSAKERAVRIELDERGVLVDAHETREADRVSRENRGELLFDVGRRAPQPMK